MVILRMLERQGLRDHIIVVMRWFGGKHLGGDCFPSCTGRGQELHQGFASLEDDPGAPPSALEGWPHPARNLEQ